MMKGYDRDQAIAFMIPRMDKKEFKPIAAQTETLLAQAIEADMAYMLDAGVLDENGLMGDSFYDDDDAFEFILERMIRVTKMKENLHGPLSAFVDQYMDLQQQFLEENGMMDWD